MLITSRLREGKTLPQCSNRFPTHLVEEIDLSRRVLGFRPETTFGEEKLALWGLSSIWHKKGHLRRPLRKVVVRYQLLQEARGEVSNRVWIRLVRSEAGTQIRPL